MPAYDNMAVAAKLDLYADLLELTGSDKYRFLAYRKAASAVRASEVQAATLAAEGGLTSIPGVGEKMAATIAAIVEAGTFPALEAVCDRIPASLADVMHVPGVGPKRATQLHDKLGVVDLDSLQAAVADGSLERLGGFGAKTADKIATSLSAHLRHRERIPLAVAWPVAQQLAADLQERVPGSRVTVVGSVRRRSETVGGIDIVVTHADTAASLDAAAGLSAVERVVARGESWIAVELHDGAAVRFDAAPPEAAGALLVWRTGSVASNKEFSRAAHDRGCDFGAAGLTCGGVPLEAAEEEAVFTALGLAYLHPEVREADPKVFAAAAAGRTPHLVELSDVRGDLQSHSTFTDGKSTLERNREVAAELGYEYLAATDHAYNLRMVGGLDLGEIERQWDEIDELNDRDDGGPSILKGIELNIADDGSLDYDDDVLSRFDIVLASLHSGWDQDATTVTARALKAIEHPLVDVFAHPTGRIIGRRDPMALDMREVLSAAGETGTIMEINSYPDRLDLSAEHIRLARTFGVRFSLGTDAHAAEQLRYMHFGVGQARRGLVPPEELLNAQPWATARTWLKRYRALS